MTAPVRDAATVVLLRDGPDGVEAWLLTRVAQMVFAAGMTVFPGGRVEDSDADLPWAGPPPVGAAFVGAAVRETFEETGVLLGGGSVDLSAARADVEGGRVGFGELLRSHGLTIDASGLRPWARWVTPEGESRRYDTRFFVAALPDGAAPDHVTSEADRAGWVGVADALAEGERGERLLMPPTLMTLRSIAAHPTVADVLTAAPGRPLEPVRPVLDGDHVRLPDGTRMRLPR
ncbi:MAG TPA: NUDIX domain-containing protein [Jatrophihabitantaceae bacterium]|jgi:8-oxo-dGTP pyrophosphatase MutT (NUDIX family)